MDINLKLDVNQVNTILRCLAKHPFEEAANIINEIQKQGNSQVAAQEKTEGEKTE